MDIVGNRNLRKLLEVKASAYPEKTFLIFEDNDGNIEEFTYKQVDGDVNRLANGLLHLGIKKGDKVNVHLSNCPEFIFSWFALSKIGAIMVPTNVLSTSHEMEYVLSHSESKAVITEPAYLNVIEDTRDLCRGVKNIILCRTLKPHPHTILLSEIMEKSSVNLPAFKLSPEDEVAILYTSGTTARPKGVVLTHAYYIWMGEVAAKHQRLGPEDRFFVVLPLFHANAQLDCFMPTLLVGGSIAIMQRFSASKYLSQVRRHKATIASLFAAPMRMILRQPRVPDESNNSLRFILFAQNLTAEQLEEFEARVNAPLFQGYGLTEMVIPLINPIDGPVKNMGIGLPTLGTEVRVVDEMGKDVPQGTSGELLIKGIPGKNLMKEYFKDPEATAEAIKDGWFHTGDIVRVDEDGYFYFVDRKKDMIKTAGENVSAAEVEGVVNQHPKVFESAAIGVPDEMRDEAIKVFVVLKEGERATEEEIIEFCSERLMKFKVPSFVEFRESLPRTSVGKIQKYILKKEGKGSL